MGKRTATKIGAVMAIMSLATFIAPAAYAAGPVKITAAYYDPVNNGPEPNTNAWRNKEYIVIRNSGNRSMKMANWVLHDKARSGVTHKFVFPGFTLRPGKSVRVHTGSGSNTSTDLYWGETVYVWGDDSDTATLQNRAGTVMSTCSWGINSPVPQYC
ncbi:MAG: lamin tail domain-containing protein [Actinomycetota bacterium]